MAGSGFLGFESQKKDPVVNPPGSEKQARSDEASAKAVTLPATRPLKKVKVVDFDTRVKRV